MDTTNESHSNLLGDYTKEENKGRYLYGDYTPLEENKNIIHVLKDFVSTSANIIEIHRNVGSLRFVLENVDVFQDEIIRKIGNLQNSVESSLDVFHTKYHERIVSSSDVKKDAESSFFRMRAPLINSIGDIERQFTKYANEYRDEIQERIIHSYNNAITLLQLWLSKDEYNLPDTLLERRNKVLIAKIDRDPYSYTITSANEIIVVNASTSNSPGADDSLESLPSSTFSYHFTIDSKFSEFWKHRRKVSDLGIDDLLIPIGFKKSISEKLRRSFGLGSSQEDSQESSERELEFVHASSLYITYIKINSGKTLAVKLSGDPTKSDEKSIEIEYNLSDLIPDEKDVNSTTTTMEGRLPRIDYLDKDERRKIDLTQKEFQEGTDTLKLIMMGRMLANRIGDISNTSAVSPHMKLDSIRVGDREAILISNDANNTLLYYEEIVMSFLELVAVGFSPLIQRISDKSPVKGELILRYETDEKERKEYVVRTEELTAPLSDEKGRRVLERLKL
ncbi:MAG: hypothetical protein WA941_03290 [Nitrososphaeraceae archaeon]